MSVIMSIAISRTYIVVIDKTRQARRKDGLQLVKMAAFVSEDLYSVDIYGFHVVQLFQGGTFFSSVLHPELDHSQVVKRMDAWLLRTCSWTCASSATPWSARTS